MNELLEAWRGGDTTYRNLHAAPVALRLGTKCRDAKGRAIPPQQVVQTSHGAEIPLAHALKLWPLVREARERQVQLTPRGCVLGHYILHVIHADGSIRVGAHNIAYEEMEHIASQLGLVSRKEIA